MVMEVDLDPGIADYSLLPGKIPVCRAYAIVFFINCNLGLSGSQPAGSYAPHQTSSYL